MEITDKLIISKIDRLIKEGFVITNNQRHRERFVNDEMSIDDLLVIKTINHLTLDIYYMLLVNRTQVLMSDTEICEIFDYLTLQRKIQQWENKVSLTEKIYKYLKS